MRWLVQLETDRDPIPACRLMNVFRRKGMSIVALALAAHPNGFSLMALVETPEPAVEHLFNFLRRTEGVQHVTYYREDASGEASFVFIEAEPETSSVTELLQRFPDSKLIFASQGKYLLKLAPESRLSSDSPGPGEPAFLTLAQVKSTRSFPSPELARALA